MRKVVVYAGTRNLYRNMRTAATSLLANNQIDCVYLLIEDDSFPFEMPENVVVINVSEQVYFPKGGANYACKWQYMTLLRCALSMMFPQENKMLWLDCDTIVDGDISELFETDMDGYYYAGVKEVGKCTADKDYINAGVLLANLEELRKDRFDYRLVMYVNKTPLLFPDQDAINELAQGKMMFLDSKYNACDFTTYCRKPIITHFAGKPMFDRQLLYRKYATEEMPVKTLIAIPCMDWVYTDFMESYENLEKPENTAFTFIKNTLIYNARNLIARQALENGFDRVFWLDSDIKLPPDALVRLCADMDTGLDFVSGVYYMRKTPTKPVVYSDIWWRVNNNEAEAGSVNFDRIPEELFEVAGTGFGCVMTSAKLLKDLVDMVGAPFTPLIGVSEDLSFCLRAKQAGYQLWCDGRIKCGHIGSHEFTEGG